MPPREDGSKAPLVLWKKYQAQRPDETLLRTWYEIERRRGVGLVCGAVSGNLEMLELEGRFVTAQGQQRFRERANQAGLGNLLDRILKGYTERTPSGGFHTLYRCQNPVEGNLKLARRPATKEELVQDQIEENAAAQKADREPKNLNPTDRPRVLIETRGEGGYVITAPSNGGIHPSGDAWVMVTGGFESIATISAEEREALLDLARSFDEMPQEAPRAPETASTADLRPGDDFNQRGAWAGILEPHGWHHVFTASDGNQHWRRPGKDVGTSATISENGEGPLYVFSTSTPFEAPHAYSKFGAYAILEHKGDFTAAAKALREQGYGLQEKLGEIRHGESVEIPTGPPPAPTSPGGEAFHGLFGRLCALIGQYVESDETSILVQLLVGFGISAGRHPHVMVGATRHAPNLYAGLIGRTSRARKGTGWDPVRALLVNADLNFASCISSGFGSGEALIHALKKVDGKDWDPRLLIQEGELAKILVVVNREGSTLSAVLRDAFDGKPLRNRVKGTPANADVHVVGMVGHCTPEELRGHLSEEQIRNGLANRILWILARRARKMANPPIFVGQDVDDAIHELSGALKSARNIGRLSFSKEAEEIFAKWYEELPDDDYGPAAAMTARAEALVLRLALVYALSDAAMEIEAEHLCAALELWDYSESCVRYLWAGTTGNPMADEVLNQLAWGPLFQSEISKEVFHSNLSSRDLIAIKTLLLQQGRIAVVPMRTGERGRPALRWERTK